MIDLLYGIVKILIFKSSLICNKTLITKCEKDKNAAISPVQASKGSGMGVLSNLKMTALRILQI